ncbi:type I secretion system permease/ATPase [Mesorhizobium sp. M7D.F.Ca.US.005.01.1.1]|uniref:ATP-binding cassette subfamily C protein n=1 Tax=Rhizobium loti TaxID=381 RepID=A0A8E3B300_RHILI|nr:type I secretion system permease/ATPase [Mesorhizobium sp. M7D.F.Ca.US.005.01.1.1]PWJ88692.1 ATP-binding cassette subfamily C protein [Mesorhizobium loti]
MDKQGTTASFARSVFDIGLFSVIINVLLLVMPLFMIQVYDRVLPAANVDTLVYLSIMAVLALAFLGLFEVVRSVYSQRVAANLDRKFASSAFAVSLRSPRADAGDIQALRELGTVRAFVASRGLSTLFDLPFVPLFIVLLALINPYLSLLTILGAAIMLILVVLTQIANRKNSAKASEQSARANLTAQAFVRNAETVRAMGMNGNITEVWGKSFGDALETQDRAAATSAVFSGISRSTRMLLQLAILGLGAWLVLQGKMTAGMIFASSIISGRALQPLDQLIGGWRQIIDARQAWLRLKKILPESAEKAPARIQLPAPSGRLTVRDLVYLPPGSAPGAEPVIKRLNFEIRAGEAIAIIGPSRAGKSTLARLLVGAIFPGSGTIEMDGADLRTWDEAQLGRSIGYLAQDIQFLPGTIAQNLARFDPKSADEAVVEAAKRAQAHELILAQREGYQTPLGASNGALSGGERQRVGLARAFYGNPRILILDEPNANLDQEGEHALGRALTEARQAGTTIVVVTHRPSLAATCDRALLLRNGIIEMFGPSAEVLKQLATGATPTRPAPQVELNGKPHVASFSTASQGSGRWNGPLSTKQG